MSNTTIQIKRSTSNAAPLLNPGELAYTTNGQVLFVGSPAGTNTANVIAIGGQRTPGTLTANQALVANSSSWIDAIQTSKLIVGTTGATINVTSISTDGSISGANNANNVLLTAAAVKDYVDNNSAATLGGLNDVDTSTASNNDILVYDAASGKWEDHTIGGTANEVEVTFTGQDITIGLPDNVTIGANLTVTTHLSTNTAAITSTTASSNTTTGALTVAGGLGVAGKINAAEVAVGNTTSYTSINATSVGVVDVLATGTVNASVLSVGGWVIANNSGVFTSGVVNADIVQVGTNFKANTTEVVINTLTSISNNVNITGTANVATGINVGSNLVITTSSITIGNSTTNSYITASSVVLDGSLEAGNTTINGSANVSGPFAAGDTTITGNASVTNVFSIGANVVLTPSSITVGNSTVNTYITSSSIAVDGTLGAGNTTVDGTLTITGNTSVNGSIVPVSNNTFDLGSTNYHFANVYANTVVALKGNFSQDVTISGNLTVNGTTTTINVASVQVTDPLIQLGTNNEVSDTVDLGFVGHYSDDAGVSLRHAGLFRDASDGRFKLFDNLIQPTIDDGSATTVDTANASFRIASVEAYLFSGGLVSNSTTVAITANSTINVAIIANTLTLSTDLEVAHGGTGKSTHSNNYVLLGNTAGPLGEVGSSTEGHVLQINSSGAPTFAMLDGGTF
jgi:hypothetical protein